MTYGLEPEGQRALSPRHVMSTLKDVGSLQPPSSGASIACRVVFMEPGRDALLLDCIATASASADDVHAGTPFAVEVDGTNDIWGAAARAALERWATDDCVIEMRFRQRGDVPQIRLYDDQTMILFDLRAAVGM
jgi:hypothetical protein